MASLRKKDRSPFWFACFTAPDGRRVQRSTKTADRKIAAKFAAQWEDASQRRLTEAQARRVLSDIHEQIHGTRLISHTVTEYVEQWLGRKQSETTAVSYSTYRHAVQEFRDFLGDRAAHPIHYVTPAQIAAWRDAAARKATARTANNKLKIVRVLFQSAWRDGLLSENPAAKVSVLKAKETDRRPFTLAELKTILAAASDEWRGLVLAGIYLGQRLKDIASLTWANVDMERDEIRFTTSKTGRRQVIPIAKPFRVYLSELPAGDDPNAPLFPGAYKIATGNQNTGVLSQQFHKLLADVGLAAPPPETHKATKSGRGARRERNTVSFHSLRHTATSLLKAAGASEAVTRDIIGHESAEISRHYTHVDEGAKRKALSKLPDLTNLK